MTTESLQHPALLGNTIDVGPMRRAAEALDRTAPALATAIRRAIPFLSRKGAALVAEPAVAMSIAEVEASLGEPNFVVHVATDPGGLRGLVAFDGDAVSYVLEGVLGGDGTGAMPLPAKGLTAPQSSLMTRFGGAVAQAVSQALEATLGIELHRLPTAGEGARETRAIAVSFRMGQDGSGGRIVIALPKDALLGPSAGVPRGNAIDPRAAAALETVPLELIAELGRIRMRLGDVMALKVGDLVTLSVPVGAHVDLRAEDQVIVRGQPTTSSGNVAIRIVEGGGIVK